MKMKYFNYEEFDSPDVQGSGQMMNEKILKMIDATRAALGKPIHINSGYRTPKHNAYVGGVESSSHLQGLAIDIDCDTSSERFELIEILLAIGFNRIGIASSFIHVDIDPIKTPNVIWTY